MELHDRGIFLKLASFLMNGFLLFTLFSGAISIADDAILRSPIDGQFFAFRGQIGALGFVLALYALVAVIVIPHFSKLALLPPVAIVMWQAIGAPGFDWSISDRSSWVPLHAMALASVVWTFAVNKLSTGHFFFAASRLPVRENLLTRTLLTMPVAAIALVLVIVGATIAAIPVFIELQSRGYVHFARNGIEVKEVVLRKGDQVVHLVGMMHIGEPQFYRDLYASIPKDALILAEGVTDREGRFKAKPTYDNAAKGLGLESQGEFQKVLSEAPAPEGAQPPSPNAPAAPTPIKQGPFVVNADVDISELSPKTLAFLDRVGTIFASSDFQQAMSRYVEISSEFTDADVKAIMDDIIIKRNLKALSEFAKYEGKFKVIYLPWGALHMPDFEDRLLARGFKIERQSMMSIARYQTVIDAITDAMGRNRSPQANWELNGVKASKSGAVAAAF